MLVTRDRALVRRLATPRTSLRHLTSQVKRRSELLRALLGAMSSDTARVKSSAAKVLRMVSEHSPQMIYPQSDIFANVLKKENSMLRWNAILVFANLAAVDKERKVDRILDGYLAPITGPHLIDAGNTMRGATAIAAAKPYLADTIAQHILGVEHATYATPECRNVAVGHAINCLDSLFPMIAEKRAIQLFVSRQIEQH